MESRYTFLFRTFIHSRFVEFSSLHGCFSVLHGPCVCVYFSGRFLIGFGVYILQSAMVTWRGTTPYSSAPLYTRTLRCRVQMMACTFLYMQPTHLSGSYGAADFCRNRVSNGLSLSTSVAESLVLGLLRLVYLLLASLGFKTSCGGK